AAHKSQSDIIRPDASVNGFLGSWLKPSSPTSLVALPRARCSSNQRRRPGLPLRRHDAEALQRSASAEEEEALPPSRNPYLSLSLSLYRACCCLRVVPDAMLLLFWGIGFGVFRGRRRRGMPRSTSRGRAPPAHCSLASKCSGADVFFGGSAGRGLLLGKLCILKGIFPRVPKKKLEGTHKTYYYTKDIALLAHDPLLEKFSSLKANPLNSKGAFKEEEEEEDGDGGGGSGSGGDLLPPCGFLRRAKRARGIGQTSLGSRGSFDPIQSRIGSTKVDPDPDPDPAFHEVSGARMAPVQANPIQAGKDIKAYDKKIKKASAKKNKDLADRLKSRRPTYELASTIKTKYPRFIDALRDLDDSLTMVHLFAALPASESTRIDVKRIHNCRRLSHEWQAYISRTHSLRKTFLSVKGIYYQAEVQSQKITWLTPHALQQYVPEDVDINVLLTFLERHETLLTFVNFKLYHSISVEYPPFLDPYLEAKAAELYALHRVLAASSRAQSEASQITSSSEQEKVENKDGESEIRLAQLQQQLPANEAGALMHLIEDASVDDNEGQETKECKSLFRNLKIFLSREVPRESLLFIIPAFGGVVSWEGDGSPFTEADQSITHQIVDRPTQGHIYLSREYVRPQWVFDCVNARIILPTDPYMVGRVLPPHLSPFVDNEAEGYAPEYAETIKRLQAAARKQVLPVTGVDSQDFDDPQSLLIERVIDRTEAQEAAEKKHKLMMLEQQYHDELNMELQGISYSESLSKKKAHSIVEEQKEDNVLDAEEVANDISNMSKVVMSRKKRKLYEAMQISKQRKRASVNLLKERKKKAESASKSQ
ncbi:hypothetical protein Taro_013919, partial [Colocasia esculenta]|nr:hypothetical protein [Colocasia esculenta]